MSGQKISDFLLAAKNMPKSVWVAVAVLVYFMLRVVHNWSFVPAHPGHPQYNGGGGSVLIQALFLYGLIKRNRSAWLYLRLASFALAIVVIPVIQGARVFDGKEELSVYLLNLGLIALPALVMAVALSLPSARVYFRMVCPQCQSLSVKGANLLFSKLKCKKCGNNWAP
jgi:hypothetical protein